MMVAITMLWTEFMDVLRSHHAKFLRELLLDAFIVLLALMSFFECLLIM